MTWLTVLLAIWLGQASKTQAPGGATVSGQVIDEITKAPVAGARVLLARIDAHLSQSIVAESDDQGRFEFKSVPQGQYRWFADGPGYARRSVTLDLGVRPDMPSLGAGGIYAGSRVSTTITLTPFGVITGHVRSERGDPAPNIFVRAWSTAGKLIAETKTNDLGEYRLYDLAAGQYVISAERYQGPRIEGPRYVTPTPPCPDCMGEGQGMVTLTTLLAQGAFIDPRVIAGRSYPQVFFPATTDRAGATPLTLTPGQQLAGIDLALILR